MLFIIYCLSVDYSCKIRRIERIKKFYYQLIDRYKTSGDKATDPVDEGVILTIDMNG